MRSFFIHAAAAVLFSVGAQAASLDALFGRADLWTMTPETFELAQIAHNRNELATRPFRWVSAARDSARAADESLNLFGMPAVEAVARFTEGKLALVTVSLYARGDVGNLPKEKYEALVRTAVGALAQATHAKMTVRGKDATNAVKADGLLWQTPASQYLLEYSATKEVKSRDVAFRAEFVRLEVSPPPQKTGLLTVGSSSRPAKFSGPAHVDRSSPEGDVMITSVPMVDQGDKGYCAVACAERVMRYYTIPVDANELAQIANTDSSRGTNPEAMLQSIKKVGARLKVKVRQVEEMDVKQILALMNDYNRAAKKSGQKPIPDQGQMLDVGAIYGSMELETLRAARTKNKAETSRFLREVQTHVDAGIPLLWSVELGIVPEKGVPKGAGGHMRLIIGYNTKTQEVIYTDSWGVGHEKKKMPLADAWCITTGAYAIEPL